MAYANPLAMDSPHRALARLRPNVSTPLRLLMRRLLVAHLRRLGSSGGGHWIVGAASFVYKIAHGRFYNQNADTRIDAPINTDMAMSHQA